MAWTRSSAGGGQSRKRSDMVYSFLILFLAIVVKDMRCEGQESCDSTNMMNCLMSVTDAADKEGLFFPDTQEKLNNYCRHLIEGLECTDRLLDKCATEEEKQLFRNLTYDIHETNLALCTEGSPLNVKFLSHVGCFKKLSDKFKACSDRYIGNILVVQGLTQDQQFLMTCCTVNEYSRCMRNVVSSRCVKDASELVEETVSRTLSTTLRHCNELGDVPKRDCRRKFTPISSQSSGNELPDEAGNAASSSGLSLTILTVLLLRLMLYR